jgi:energy-coupling factor transporter transmembrane protein EcfT
LVVVVALAFVPSTLGAIQDVREADRARTGGRVVRRGRLLHQLVPVLELGLERAVTLSESMDARGFARAGAGPRDHVAGWCGACSLLALGGAFVALVGNADTAATLLGVGGLVGLGIAVTLAASGTRRTRYRPRRMTAVDWGAAGAALLAPAALAVVSVVGDATLVWAPSPVAWPALHVAPVLALLPLLVPIGLPARLRSGS